VSELLAALPGHSTRAYVLVQHLDPAHDSLLPEILAKKTAMSVSQMTAAWTKHIHQPNAIPSNSRIWHRPNG